MTDERMQLLAEYLSNDPERMERLLAMNTVNAMEAINADGYDFTVDELTAFADQVEMISKKVSKDGELNEEDLNEVSGGILMSTVIAGATALGITVALYMWKYGRNWR